MNVVISQSMFFPWVGFLEQLQLADVFVFYDDVPFSKGSFTNRIQIKTANGPRWMTVPLDGHKTGMTIDEVNIKEKKYWFNKHLSLLKQSFSGAPYLKDAIDLVEEVYQADYNNLGELSRASMLAIFNYFDIAESCQFFDVKDLSISGKGNDRVLSIVQAVNGNNYITGHGAINYLDHGGFETAGITVKYMNYQSLPYKQLHGSFTPYVSALDLIANCGKEGEGFIANNKSTIPWDEFISISLKK
ncbi:MAG: hypothetical protein GQ532_17640 [Methylomarinum sp.]|nr:hypothetical protein [Methylomarinum sp.]